MDNPTSPSMGLPLAWDDELGIWLGVPGWDGQTAGGLWHSDDKGKSWQWIEGFRSVNSIGIRIDGGAKSIVVSELHFNTWRNLLLVPYPSRVVSIRGDKKNGSKPTRLPLVLDLKLNLQERLKAARR